MVEFEENAAKAAAEAADPAEAATPTGAVAPTDAASEIVVRVFGRTDVGLVREHNEDNFLIADLTAANRSILPEVRTHRIGPRGTVFTVCDGMGGAAAGEVASRIGIDTIYEILQGGETPVGDVALARRLNEAICEAGTRIFTAAKLNRQQRGMGTTVTAAVLNGPRLIIGQVGDSRAHVVRNGALVQVTKDQSLVQQLIDAKQLTSEEAKAFDRSNIILQALGTTEEVHVDVTSVPLRRGDILVMCSDGLSGRVDADVICRVVIESEEPMDACRRLTELACENGGDDNITVIVARFGGGGLPEPTADEVVTYRPFEFRQVTETTTRAAIPKFEDDEPEPKQAPTAAPEIASAGEPPAATGAERPEADATAAPEAERVAPAAAGPATERRPAEAAEPVADAARRGTAGGKRRSGVIAGVVVAVIACAGVGYVASRGGGAEEGGEPTAAAPASASPVRPSAPIPASAAPKAAAAVEEPRLQPTAEERILGTGEEVAPAEAKERPAGDDRPPKKKEAASGSGTTNPYAGGSGGAGQASKKKEDVKDDGPAAPAPQPKKKPASDIEENPY
jgi:protein phosphatase